MTTLALSTSVARRRTFLLASSFAVAGVAIVLGAIGAQEPTLAVAAVLVLGGGVACLFRPDAATYIVVAVLYSNVAALAVQFHGLPYFIGLAFPLLLLLPLAYYVVLHRTYITITSAFPLLFLLAIVEVLGSAASRDIQESLSQFMGFAIGGVGLYFLLTNVIRSIDTLKRVIWVVLVVAAGLGVLSLFQTVTGAYGTNFWGLGQVNLPGANTQFSASVVAGGTPRLAGPVGEVNRYGQIMLVLLPIGALVAYSERRHRVRLAAVVATAFILFGMAATGSRGAAVGLAVVVLAALAFRYVRIRHLALVALAVGVTLVAFPRYGERLVDLQGLLALDDTGTTTAQGDVGNLRSRATETLAALLVFTDHPVIGVGPGMFPLYYREYAERLAAEAVDTRIDQGNREAHNLYTDVAAETGVLGLACFMGILLITLRDLRRARIRWLATRPDVAHLASAFFLAILAYMASGMFLHLSYERYFWLLVALAGVAAHLALHLPDDAGVTGTGETNRRSAGEGQAVLSNGWRSSTEPETA
jgi:putative inorganic carbon (HCO3(-)) transporter